jgi:hypothetical protein
MASNNKTKARKEAATVKKSAKMNKKMKKKK